jgi:hypothetical protein
MFSVWLVRLLTGHFHFGARLDICCSLGFGAWNRASRDAVVSPDAVCRHWSVNAFNASIVFSSRLLWSPV